MSQQRGVLATPTEEMSPVLDSSPQNCHESSKLTVSGVAREVAIALLTGGSDRPYVFGLTTSLISRGGCHRLDR